MHQHDRHGGARDYLQHPLVGGEGPLVVDHGRAGGDGLLGDRSLGGVDADWDVDLSRDGLYGRHYPRQLFVDSDRTGAGVDGRGARRLPADVEYVGAPLPKSSAVLTTASTSVPRPSPEKESGVTLITPMMNVLSPQTNVLPPMFVRPRLGLGKSTTRVSCAACLRPRTRVGRGAWRVGLEGPPGEKVFHSVPFCSISYLGPGPLGIDLERF